MTDPTRAKALVDTLVDRHYELLNKLDSAEEDLRKIAAYITQIEHERDSWRAVAEGHTCVETLAARTEEREALRVDLEAWRARCLRAESVFVQLETALKKIIDTARLDPPAPDGSAQAFGARAHLEAVLIAQDA